VLAPIRAVASLGVLLGSLLAGAGVSVAVLAWAVGAGLMLILLVGDPRRRRRSDPVPIPPDAARESWGQIALTDIFPSTVAVTMLGVIALAFDQVLAAVLAGILGGMALMTVASLVMVALDQRRHHRILFAERRGPRLFEEPTPYG
jgi:hypothetical protein